MIDQIPFSVPFRAAGEVENVRETLRSGHVHGDGPFTRSASSRLSALLDGTRVLLTASGTAALEMSARLLDLGPGDEVVLPSFTFPSAANSIALTGATCVFVDIDPATGNIDPLQVAEAIGPRTRAVSVMHYGGVPVDMAAIESVVAGSGIAVIEDDAHGLGVRHEGRVLGTRGSMGVQSFHATKNLHSGEGGALVLGDAALIERAEIIREKGTDRSRFLRGEVDKYSWVDLGSSHLMSELNAAVLDAQLAVFDEIQGLRHSIWNRYATELAAWAAANGFRLMSPPGGVHAAHVFWMLAPDAPSRAAMLQGLRGHGVSASFHYVPLDSSSAGRRWGRTTRPLAASASFSDRLIRLPLWPAMSEDQVTRTIDAVRDAGRVGTPFR